MRTSYVDRLALITAAPLLVFALGACGRADAGDAVATAAGPGGADANAVQVAEDPQERARQFTECMRAEGIDMDDPEAAGSKGGDVKIYRGGQAGTAEEGTVLTEDEGGRFTAAMQTCRVYLPNGGEPVKPTPEELTRLREFAKCMRDNGVPDFPDPDPDGGLGFTSATTVEKGAKEVEDAMEKCNQHLPVPAGESAGAVVGGVG